MTQIANILKIKCKAPEVGDGATVYLYTDRHAATVVRVSKSGRTAWIQPDSAKRIDNNGMSESQDYEYSANTDAQLIRVSIRKDGQWRKSGEYTKVAFGIRNAYHDYSF